MSGLSHDSPAPPRVGSVECSVVIPTLGREDMARVLAALGAQTFADFEVVVVSDGPETNLGFGEAMVVSGHSLVTLGLAENRGQAAARNAGIAAAQGRIVIFLDDDMIPGRDFVERLMAHHHAREGATPRVVCGRIVEDYLIENRSPLESWLRERRDNLIDTALVAIASGELIGRAYVCCGAACSVSRQTLLSSGGFRDDLRYVHEDADLGLRLMDAGVEFVVEPAAFVRHQNRKQMRDSFLAGNKALGATHVHLARTGDLRHPHSTRLATLQRSSRSRTIASVTARLKVSPVAPEHGVERLVELSGSRRAAEAWRSLAGQRAYVDGVEAAGESRESAARLVRSGPMVLSMHTVGDPDKGAGRRFSIHPDALREICRRLASAGWKGVSLASALANRVEVNQVALTFDDGYEDFVDVAVPILGEFGYRATVYVVSGLIGRYNSWDVERGRKARRLLSAAQIRELSQRQFEVGSHSVSHAWLPHLELGQLRGELRDSRAALEDVTGCNVSSFSYPSGGVNVRVRFEAGSAGYASAVTSFDGSNVPLDRLAIERWQVDRDHSPRGVVRTVVSGRDYRQPAFGPIRRLATSVVRRFPSVR